MSNNQNPNEAPQGGDLVLLTDDLGNEVRYEFLDVIKYNEKDYAVLVPEDGEDVEIFIVEDGDQETNTLLPVNDQDEANAVFELFKTANADNFDFS